MRISEIASLRTANGIDPIASEEDAINKLKKHGFNLLSDEGTYSTIWTHPRLDYVLKLYREQDKGYTEFAELASRHQSNPHFPRFRGLPIRVSPGIIALRIERLQPWVFNRNDPDHVAIDWLLSYADDPDWKKALEDEAPEAVRKKVLDFMEKWPGFARAIGLMAESVSKNPDIGFDFVDQNIMMRGDCPVITDPFSPIT